MPIRNGDENNNNIDLRGEPSTQPADWPENQAWWQVDAKEGNDTVHGTVDNDSIHGGTGDDTLRGNNGNDGLYGDAGDDFLYGGNGEDWIDGGDGVDQLYGDANDDWLTAGAGNDYLDGGAGADTLVGGAGNDRNFGQAGDDVILDGAGADVLDGGAGNDRLWGGAGDDQYQFTSGIDVINDGVNEAGNPRTDATNDIDVLLVGYSLSDLYIYDNTSNGIVITSVSDLSDGVVNNAVVLDNFYAGGHYVVEYLYTNDGYEIDLRQFLPTELAA